MKWDSSHQEKNLRTDRTYTVRECFFQDTESAQTLRDVGGQRLTFREFGSERLLAIAKRDGRQWICTRWIKGVSQHYFAGSKDIAIDFLLGRDVPESIHNKVEQRPLPGMES